MRSSGDSSSAAVDDSKLLAPGFRFHPTDEELVTYYLKRKIQSKPLRVDAIAEVDLYKCEPWDLPSRSRIRSRDLEWYFFSPLDRKHSNNRLRTNRGTLQGYWKTTGKDREVKHGRGRAAGDTLAVVGMKKTLVYHFGRAPRGKRTNWVMHEYRLLESDDAGICQDSYVVCRIFQKNGPGPQNGAQYGAPFIEEEWDQPTAESNGLPMMMGFPHVEDEEESNEAPQPEFLQMDDLLEGQDCFGKVPEMEPAPAIPEPEMFQLEELFKDPNLTTEEPTPTPDSVIDQSSPSKIDEYLELDDLASDLLLATGNSENDNTLNIEEFFDLGEDVLPMNDALYSPVATSQNSGLDFVDEFLTYYDAPDDNLFYNDFNNDFTYKADEGSFVPPFTYEETSSSAAKLPEVTNDKLYQENEGFTVETDKKPLGKFASFLDSISAPPAFAEEFPSDDITKSTALLSRGNMVQFNSLTVTSTTENGEMLVYKSVDFDTVTDPKLHCGISSILRGGFCLFSISAFMLLASYKIGLCVCDR